MYIDIQIYVATDDWDELPADLRIVMWGEKWVETILKLFLIDAIITYVCMPTDVEV